MIYLDNAATTFPKPRSVTDELIRCVRTYCGNPGRSSHRLSLRASEQIYSVRERISEHFRTGAPERVVFTYNATYALNLAIKTFVREPCHLILSDLEHNAVMRPIHRLCKELGVEYSLFNSDLPTEKAIEECIRPDTKGIVSTLQSNVTGKVIPLAELAGAAKKHGLFLIADASQAAGHISLDLTDSPCDALCAPGHKGMFGIQGCGFAIFRDDKRKCSFIEGGSGSDSKNPEMPLLLPEGYEAGTLATPAIVTLGRGLQYVEERGIAEVERYVCELTDVFSERLLAIEGVKLIAAQNGIISFTYKDISSSFMAGELDRRGICVRGGLHCAPSAHEKLGTLDGGAVRISLSIMNKERDADGLYRAMKNISRCI